MLCELQRADPTFLQRFSQHPKNRGGKRRYVPRSSEDLYPDSPDLRRHHKQQSDNWLLSTNRNNRLKKAILQAAAEVAGLKLGGDIIIEFCTGFGRACRQIACNRPSVSGCLATSRSSAFA